MIPLVTHTVAAAREAIAQARLDKRTVGLVPTMGALHAGHASLIRAARAETDFVVVSIFVNPTQFGPKEDLARYPRNLAQDLHICAEEQTDLVFHPEPTTMYPPDFQTYVETHELQKGLCGASRPGHFRGVCTVVLKLFNIVQPDFAYFGQKDAQQVRVLQRMVSDLDVPVEVRVCPIVRESDGLAMSSRNQYLAPSEREQAVHLSWALESAAELVRQGERRAAVVEARIREQLAAAALIRVDYVALVDWQRLQSLETLRGRVLIALACFVGTTRLIDNVVLDLTD